MIAELLDELQTKGITLVADGDKLYYRGDKGSLTPEVIAELRAHKSEILFLMKCGQCGIPVVGPISRYWRVLLGSGPVYLCSAECAYRTWPWTMEVSSDNRYEYED